MDLVHRLSREAELGPRISIPPALFDHRLSAERVKITGRQTLLTRCITNGHVNRRLYSPEERNLRVPLNPTYNNGVRYLAGA